MCCRKKGCFSTHSILLLLINAYFGDCGVIIFCFKLRRDNDRISQLDSTGSSVCFNTCMFELQFYGPSNAISNVGAFSSDITSNKKRRHYRKTRWSIKHLDFYSYTVYMPNIDEIAQVVILILYRHLFTYLRYSFET